MDKPFTLRAYTPEDCAQMAQLFYDTVHTVCLGDYTGEQLDVWATGSVDIERWNKKFLANHTVVAVSGQTIVGYGDMESGGYLDFLYVHKDWQRKGVATAICNALEGSAKAERLSVHASVTARPFFEKRGYNVIKEQTVYCGGVPLTNFVMDKL